MNINVIATGGKQYVVSEGQVITIEKPSQSIQKGDKISFDKVLLTTDGEKTNIGSPIVSGAEVTGEVVVVGRAKKVVVIKYKAKSRYFKNRGHRQPFAKVKITKIA